MNNFKFLILTILLCTSVIILSACSDESSDHEHNDHAEHGHDDHNDHDNHDTPHTRLSLSAAKEAGVELAEVQEGMVNKTIHLIGKIIENPDKKTTIHGRFSGVVVGISAQLGDVVKKGQLLAQIESDESLQVYEVRAPIGGVIVARDISLGDSVRDHEIFRIADLSEVWAEVHIFPKDINHVKRGANVLVQDIASNTEAMSKLELILPIADAYSQTIIGVAPLANPENQWLPGMAIEADASIEQRPAKLTVSRDAIQTLENKPVVFVYEEGRFEARHVKLGLKGDDTIEVLSGVSAGEIYAAKGSFVIKADIGKAAAEHNH